MTSALALSPGDTRYRHREMLAIALLVLPACFLLEVHPNGRVGLSGYPRLLLPPLCLSRDWFGLTCPGCGLTRSFIHLAHGDWHASFQAHRLGWLLAAALLLQIPYRLHELCRPGKPLLSSRTRKGVGHALIALLLVHWTLTMLVGSS